MRSPPPNVNTISQQLNCTRFCFSLSPSIAFFLHRYFHVFVGSFSLQVPFDNKISNDRRHFCPANLRSNNVVIVTIKVLLISLPKVHPNFTALCTTIQIALRREGNDYGKKHITNIKFVCCAIEIADFTAHFRWMRFQSFWMTQKALCVCTRRLHEGTLYFFSRSLRFIRNKTSNKVHPNFDFPMDAY